jgi:hypothetical protein
VGPLLLPAARSTRLHLHLLLPLTLLPLTLAGRCCT